MYAEWPTLTSNETALKYALPACAFLHAHTYSPVITYVQVMSLLNHTA